MHTDLLRNPRYFALWLKIHEGQPQPALTMLNRVHAESVLEILTQFEEQRRQLPTPEEEELAALTKSYSGRLYERKNKCLQPWYYIQKFVMISFVLAYDLIVCNCTLQGLMCTLICTLQRYILRLFRL